MNEEKISKGKKVRSEGCLQKTCEEENSCGIASARKQRVKKPVKKKAVVAMKLKLIQKELREFDNHGVLSSYFEGLSFNALSLFFTASVRNGNQRSRRYLAGRMRCD